MSQVKSRSMTFLSLRGFPEKCLSGMIVQREERNPETSVNKLLFAGSRMSVFPSGGCPGLRSGVDLSIGHTG